MDSFKYFKMQKLKTAERTFDQKSFPPLIKKGLIKCLILNMLEGNDMQSLSSKEP